MQSAVPNSALSKTGIRWFRVNKLKSRLISFPETMTVELVLFSVKIELLMQADRDKMKNWIFLLSFLFSGLPFVLASTPFISLDIPQHHFSESGQQTHTTFITKKYYFVMFFKASSRRLIAFTLQTYRWPLTGQFLPRPSLLQVQ